jgi:hypothetical protein
MRTIDRRLGKLENRFGMAQTKTSYLRIVNDAGSDLGAAQDTYLQILDEAGFFHAGGFNLVDLSQVPHGLSEEETERFVRENGAKICSLRGARSPELEAAAGKASGR